jgi:microcystin-dependent protein
MSQPFIGEIRMFGGSFAPAGWAFCDGQLQPISQNDALFTLLGTTYGGDGQETFGIPNLQSRTPVHQGQGPGISQNYILGEAAGVESVTLTTQQIPVHNHALVASTNPANQIAGTGGILAAAVSQSYMFAAPPDVTLNAQTLTPVGGSQPHDNLQPYLVVSFIISLFGIFPRAN